MRARLAVPLVVVLAFGCAATARADMLLAPASGARNLAVGGGWTAWAAPTAGGRWRLVVRSPAGVVRAARMRAFGAPPDPSIGSTSYNAATKRLVAVYARCHGRSSAGGCDLFAYDLRAATERKLTRLSSRAASELAPSIFAGTIAFARRGGPRPGLYVAGRRTLHRLDGRVVLETAISPSRVAFRARTTDGRDEITMVQYDGRLRRVLARSLGGVLRCPVITRYRVGWLERGPDAAHALLTDRVRAGDPHPAGRPGTHDLPPTTDSLVADSSQITTYLDAVGVHRADPSLFDPLATAAGRPAPRPT